MQYLLVVCTDADVRLVALSFTGGPPDADVRLVALSFTGGPPGSPLAAWTCRRWTPATASPPVRACISNSMNGVAVLLLPRLTHSLCRRHPHAVCRWHVVWPYYAGRHRWGLYELIYRAGGENFAAKRIIGSNFSGENF